MPGTRARAGRGRGASRLLVGVGALILAGGVLAPRPSRAGSYTITLQPDKNSTNDSYLAEDAPLDTYGAAGSLMLQASPDQTNRHVIVHIPLSPLQGKSILQAWLRLSQSAGSASIPIEARIYPLTEVWTEPKVSWTNRTGQPWTVPGGTHGPLWSERRLVTEATTGGTVSWQVGPILQAAQLGLLIHYGFEIEADRTGPTREVAFWASEDASPSNRPALVVQYTDEPPAVQQGVAEIQPRAVPSGASDTPLTLWLNVDAAASTPSGAATGFDTLTVEHGGGLTVTGVTGFSVNGQPVSLGLVSWLNGASSTGFRFPRIQTQAVARMDLRVTVLSPPLEHRLDLPVTVDDSATPGAWAQALWPGDADGVAGNGDDWILGIASPEPVRIELGPDTLQVVERMCASVDLSGVDGWGNHVPLQADSFRVEPAGLGTITAEGSFCGLAPGTGRIIAYWSSLRDTAIAVVSPALTPQVLGVALRTSAGATTGALAPGDTMLLDVTLADGDGFQDVRRIELTLALAGHLADVGEPAYRAALAWGRSSPVPWTLADPAGSSWEVLPGLCQADTLTNSTSPQTVRFAFRVGRIARASSTGEWGTRLRVFSATPPDTTQGDQAGWDCLPRVTLVTADTAGAFNPGPPGALHLALARPADGSFTYQVEANTPWSLEAAASDMVGLTTPSDTLHVGPPTPRMAWAFNASGTGGGLLDTSFTALTPGRPAATLEGPGAWPVYLWLDHPPALPDQRYRGELRVRAVATGFAATSAADLPLTALVLSGGLAAQSALAEVLPHVVQAGTVDQAFDVFLLPQFQASDTGIDHLLVDLPDAYGATAVTLVEVAGSPVSFADLSSPGLAELVLPSRVTSSQLVHLRLQADVPTELDAPGSPFVALYDDTATAVPPQTAMEGNANGLPDGNSWSVQVVPGPLARLEASPAQVVTYVDSVVSFTARGFDAFGHEVEPAETWSVADGIGTVDPASGVFTARNPGQGLVIASCAGTSDTAQVTVWRARAIAVRSVAGPAVVHQDQSGVALTVRVENLGGVPVALDSLRLSFSRGAPGDANGDFAWSASPLDPDTLAVGGTVSLQVSVAVAADAVTGPLAVDARVSGLEAPAGVRLTDPTADTTLVMRVDPAGVEIAASQEPGAVRPGQSGAQLLTVDVHNLYPDERTLTGLDLENLTTGPGDEETLDGELGTLSLYLDDGDQVLDPDRDALLLRTLALDARVHLAPLAASVPPMGEARLFVTGDVPLQVRDGDALDLALTSPAGVTFDPPSVLRNAWPISPAGALRIDGMVADQIVAEAFLAPALHPGATDVLAFQVLLPANGYQADQLDYLSVSNLGTALPAADLVRLRAWVDDGDSTFDAAHDRSLGALAFTGARWQLTGLAEPVPPGGLRVFVTADVADLATQGRTLRLALPAGTLPAVGMASGNSGPVDRDLVSPQLQTVSVVDRVLLSTLPVSPGTARPGDRDLVTLHLVASNGYAEPRTLTDLSLANVTSGSGTQAELDQETQVLTLRADGNGNGALDGPEVDSVLATGFFSQGRTAFTGLRWTLPALSARQLFVTAGLSATEAADGDRVGCTVDAPNSVGFEEPTAISATWPLDSGGRWTVDGFIGDQLALSPTPAVTLGPGDGPVLALDLVVPPNGYRADVLNGVLVTDLGTAAPADLAAVQLWQDGGDGVFSAGGDDVLLGPLTPQAMGWQSALLASNVAPPGVRLFVSVTVAAAPADSVTVRLAVPVGGVQNASGNDGPVDVPVTNPNAILISRAPLLATLALPAASTLGQSVAVRMMVRNVGSETVTDITPTAPAVTGTGSLTWASGPEPASLSLAPAETDTFVWSYVATGTGEVRLESAASGTGATSGLTRRSPQAGSALHRVFLGADNLLLTPVPTMPVTVHRGQTDVVPFSLTFSNPAGENASSVRVRGLRLRLATEAGQPIVPADLLERVLVNEGTSFYLVKVALETSGDQVDLPLATPVNVIGTEPTTLNLRLDIADGTTVPGFRVEIADSTWLTAEDATTGAPVTVRLSTGDYPVRSDPTRVVEEATDLNVSLLAADSTRAGRGATGVRLLDVRCLSPGVPGITSDVRVSSLAVGLLGEAGTPILQPGSRVKALRVRNGGQVAASLVVDAGAGPEITVPLSPPLNLAASSPLDLVVEGDVSDDAPLGAFRLRLLDSTRVDAWDAESRRPVSVHLQPDTLAGGYVTVEAAAESLAVAATPALPETVGIGTGGVRALAVTLRHPGAPGTARIRVDSLRVSCRDQQGRALSAAAYLSRLRVAWDGVEIAVASNLPASGAVTVPLPGPRLEPGDSARVELSLDVSPAAPTGMLELVVPQACLYASDANSSRPVTATPSPGTEFPLTSGLTRLVSPSRDLAVGLASRMPAALAADGRPVVAAVLTLANRDPQGSGPIGVDWLRVAAADGDHAPLALGTVAEGLEAYVADVLWAQSAPLTPDSLGATLIGLSRLSVSQSARVEVELRWTPRSGAPSPSVRLGMDHDDIGVAQPGSGLLTVQVHADSGQVFPLWSEAGNFSVASLAQSYANFPNPFAAGREATAFVYYLRAPARVSLRILTPRGESVATLLDDAARGAGLQQSDSWSGRNGRGDAVANGVYVAELKVRFDDGGSERLLRKLAVVR